MGALGQPSHRIGKLHLVELHHESEQVAALAASEAMPELRVRIYLAGRGFLLVKRTAAPEIAATLLQGHALAHDVDDIVGLANSLDVFLREAGHVLFRLALMRCVLRQLDVIRVGLGDWRVLRQRDIVHVFGITLEALVGGFLDLAFELLGLPFERER